MILNLKLKLVGDIQKVVQLYEILKVIEEKKYLSFCVNKEKACFYWPAFKMSSALNCWPLKAIPQVVL